MSDRDTWQEANTRYLSTALAWLRLRLEHYSQQWQTETSSQSLEQPQLQKHSGWKRPAAPDQPVSKQAVSTLDEQIAQKEQEMIAAETQSEPPPALVILSKNLKLSPFEQYLLLLCVAIELDARFAALCARAQDDPGRPFPTFALFFALFNKASWDALSPERPLRYWRLIEINQPGAQPLTTSPLRADERIVNYVKGLNYLDDRLTSFLAPFQVDDGQVALPASQAAIAQQINRSWQHVLQRHTFTSSQLPIIQLVGPDTSSKQLVAGQVASDMGLPFYRLPVEMLPSQTADLETFARLWQRESRLQLLALYLDAQEIDGTPGSEGQIQMASLSRFLGRCDAPFFFLSTRETWSHTERAQLIVDVAKPTPTEQQAAWKQALGAAAFDNPGRLASQFNLDLPTIYRIVRTELDEGDEDKSTLSDRLWKACLERVRPRLDILAQRLDPKATWKDLVLPDEEMSILQHLAGQVGQRHKVYEEWGFAEKMNRGLGINALFAGESGTGKTMVAEVIANALRLNLYRIDLSAVVSKYIGETEKNLRRLFDAAEDGGAILFFDEADALFGKRSEVKDSHDRYANIEINYLLQRMEAYRGLAILATNMKNALDPAFIRRLRFVINFPFPGAAERKRIWKTVFPSKLKPRGLDYDRLARFNLTGGSIHNIAINAAFLAAQAGTPVTMPLILIAARSEFRKLERPINEAEFRWQEPSAPQDAKGVTV